MATKKIKVLIVDDDEVMRKLIGEVLVKEGFEIALASSGEVALKILRGAGKDDFPIVVSDIRMLEIDGMTLLYEVKKKNADASVILMTGFGNMEGAIEAIQHGAFDYISKPFKMDELKALVHRAAKHWGTLMTPQGSSHRRSDSAKLALSTPSLIGKTPRILEVYKTLARAALSSSSVLITGESGTGKELVARVIHENGPRKGKPFVNLSCGSSTEGELEAEMQAAVLAADQGTLFFDEVGDLTPNLQHKLLKILQAGEVKSQKFDVRTIAASQKSLEDLREDLFYKLKVISIELPSLRERIEDLPELVGAFIEKFAEKNKKPVSHLSEEAMHLLKAYSWPGNVRELEHAIERAVAMTNSPVLFPEDFPSEIAHGGRGAATQVGSLAALQASGGPSHTSLEDMERAHIVKVLTEAGFNKSKASEILGIDRATLYRKAQRYGIDLRGPKRET